MPPRPRVRLSATDGSGADALLLNAMDALRARKTDLASFLCDPPIRPILVCTDVSARGIKAQIEKLKRENGQLKSELSLQSRAVAVGASRSITTGLWTLQIQPSQSVAGNPSARLHQRNRVPMVRFTQA